MSKHDLKSVVSKDALEDIAKDLSDSLVPNNYPEDLNPFKLSLNKLSRYENLKLSAFLEKVILAKSKNELKKIVNMTLNMGLRINARNEDGFSFSDVTVFKMFRDGFIEKNIIKKLVLSGADFDRQNNKKIVEICSKIQKEVKPQIYDRLRKLREVAENAAIEGTVRGVEFDNQTFYIKFSQKSKVDVAKVIDGARNLGFNKGALSFTGNIIKIGDGEIELKTGKNGEKDYIDISDNSSFIVTFLTNFGELHIKIYQDTKNCDQIQVEVENKEVWLELQKIGETVGPNCLFGGMPVKTAIEKGYFMRSGRWGNQKSTETIKYVEPQGSEVVSWVDRIKNNKTTSLERT